MRCHGCGAAIRFLRTPTGKQMPVDTAFLSEWVTDMPSGTPPRRITLMSGDGARAECGYLATAITPAARHIQGYQPHWASCPKATEFRRSPTNDEAIR
jgi:hypothetical protein